MDASTAKRWPAYTWTDTIMSRDEKKWMCIPLTRSGTLSFHNRRHRNAPAGDMAHRNLPMTPWALSCHKAPRVTINL